MTTTKGNNYKWFRFTSDVSILFLSKKEKKKKLFKKNPAKTRHPTRREKVVSFKQSLIRVLRALRLGVLP